ncbi:hypothetical protein [Aquimarina sediminis]|uniref:hypothetical protein n=1 Tax=Aquimarina sediminis TaxID=2070536 RepID=UPI000FFEFD21|nr:hypothetical protein [Aquimarina sediminis]
MKNLKAFNQLKCFVLILCIGTFLMTSCEQDEELKLEKLEEITTKKSEKGEEISGECYVGRASCPDNLTNNGCDFTSGSGRDMPNQYLMVDMLNNCRRQSLPSNCSWWSNITETRVIKVDLNNCCYPAYAMTGRLNSWKNAAVAARPSSAYLITNYERIGGFMVTTYGPYRMSIRVTYRKKICSAVANPDVVRE